MVPDSCSPCVCIRFSVTSSQSSLAKSPHSHPHHDKTQLLHKPEKPVGCLVTTGGHPLMLLYMIFLVIVYLLYVDIGTSVLHKILDNAIPILRITPVFLPGEFHEQRDLEDYSLWGCKESDTTEWLTPSLLIAYLAASGIFMKRCYLYHKGFREVSRQVALPSPSHTISWLSTVKLKIKRNHWYNEEMIQTEKVKFNWVKVKFNLGGEGNWITWKRTFCN